MYLDKIVSIEKCIKMFDDYLHYERGLSPSYRYRCCRIAQLFLKSQYGNRPVRFSLLKPHAIPSFILSYSKKNSPQSTRIMTSSLRSFLRFLTFQYAVPNFISLIPAIGVWAHDKIPNYLSKSEIKKLLNTFNKKTQDGLRNYTILKILYSLGLRASEAANLTLDDINWNNGELCIRGKGLRLSKMPLSQGLGDELVNYLLNGRPLCDLNIFFVSTQLKAMTRQSISTIVSQALKNAGLYHKKGIGAHVLRHSLATHLLQCGATMQQISEVLRHRSIDTTQIYAKVDFKRLKSLAPPWPQAWNSGGVL